MARSKNKEIVKSDFYKEVAALIVLLSICFVRVLTMPVNESSLYNRFIDWASVVIIFAVLITLLVVLLLLEIRNSRRSGVKPS